MTLDELEKLADAAINAKYHMQIIDANQDYAAKANPQTIKQLIALCRLQHEALLRVQPSFFCVDPAIAAYEEFNK